MNSETKKRIQSYLNGTCSEKDRKLLTRKIKEDRKIRDEFVCEVRTHSLIRDYFSEKSEAEGMASRLGPTRLISMKGAAAILVIGIAIVAAVITAIKLPVDETESIGRVSESGLEGSVCISDGVSVPLTRLTLLKSGDRVITGPGRNGEKITVTLVDKSRIVIGPQTDIVLSEQNRIQMHHGDIRCRVAPQQQGFVVDIVLVDAQVRVLGTEFTIKCTESKGDDDMNSIIVRTVLVTVLSGTVAVTEADNSESVLRAGDSHEIKRRVVNLTAGTASAGHSDKEKPVSPLDRRLSVDFQNTPLSEVLAFLRGVSGLNVILDKRDVKTDPAPKDMGITIKVTDMKLEDALFWVARKAGMVCVVKEHDSGKAVVFGSSKHYPRHMKLHPVLVRVIESGEKRPGVTYRKVKNILPGSDEYCNAYPEITKKMQKPVTFNFVGVDFADAVSVIRNLTGLNIICDYGVAQKANKVGLKVVDMTLSLALSWVCKANNLTYTVARQAILISDREVRSEAQIRMEKALKKKKAKVINLSTHSEDCKVRGILFTTKIILNSEVFKKDLIAVVADVQKKSNVSIVVTPGAASALKDRKLILQILSKKFMNTA